jgi:hypothetical protein
VVSGIETSGVPISSVGTQSTLCWAKRSAENLETKCFRQTLAFFRKDASFSGLSRSFRFRAWSQAACRFLLSSMVAGLNFPQLKIWHFQWKVDFSIFSRNKRPLPQNLREPVEPRRPLLVASDYGAIMWHFSQKNKNIEKEQKKKFAKCKQNKYFEKRQNISMAISNRVANSMKIEKPPTNMRPPSVYIICRYG